MKCLVCQIVVLKGVGGTEVGEGYQVCWWIVSPNYVCFCPNLEVLIPPSPNTYTILISQNLWLLVGIESYSSDGLEIKIAEKLCREPSRCLAMAVAWSDRPYRKTTLALDYRVNQWSVRDHEGTRWRALHPQGLRTLVFRALGRYSCLFLFSRSPTWDWNQNETDLSVLSWHLKHFTGIMI